MIRKVIGVVAGYLSMAIFIFIGFTILYLILGAEGSFKSGSYMISTTWLLLSIVIGFIAAVLGGYICAIIAKHKKTVFVLAGVVFLLGIIMAIPEFGANGEVILREGDVSNMDAMANAKQPLVALIINPIIGALGVLLGLKLWKEKDAG